MSKRYEEPADVEAPDGSIESFWWRGRRYRVTAVLARWREAGGWWESASDTAQPWARGDSREIWRVDAVPVFEEASQPPQSPPSPPRARALVSMSGSTEPRGRVATQTRAHHPAGKKRRARRIPTGTYELSRDLRKGSWLLLRVLD